MERVTKNGVGYRWHCKAMCTLYAKNIYNYDIEMLFSRIRTTNKNSYPPYWLHCSVIARHKSSQPLNWIQLDLYSSDLHTLFLARCSEYRIKRARQREARKQVWLQFSKPMLTRLDYHVLCPFTLTWSSWTFSSSSSSSLLNCKSLLLTCLLHISLSFCGEEDQSVALTNSKWFFAFPFIISSSSLVRMLLLSIFAACSYPVWYILPLFFMLLSFGRRYRHSLVFFWLCLLFLEQRQE